MHKQAHGIYLKIAKSIYFNAACRYEIAAADWSVEESRGTGQQLGPIIHNIDIDALLYIISSM